MNQSWYLGLQRRLKDIEVYGEVGEHGGGESFDEAATTVHRRQVEDDVAWFDRLECEFSVREVTLKHFHHIRAHVAGEVPPAPTREIIDDDNPSTRRSKMIHQGRTDEACASCHDAGLISVAVEHGHTYVIIRAQNPIQSAFRFDVKY